jgi:hypothetical protein
MIEDTTPGGAAHPWSDLRRKIDIIPGSGEPAQAGPPGRHYDQTLQLHFTVVVNGSRIG